MGRGGHDAGELRAELAKAEVLTALLDQGEGGCVPEHRGAAVDAKAKALTAAGEDVVGFGAGEPDFATPEHIVEAAAAACHDPRNHKYTPTPALPELRAAIAAKTVRDSGLVVDPSQVLVTNG